LVEPTRGEKLRDNAQPNKAVSKGQRVTTGPSPSLQAAEAEVQAHSSILRRELGIASLIFAQILFAVVPDYFGTAVKAGANSQCNR